MDGSRIQATPSLAAQGMRYFARAPGIVADPMPETLMVFRGHLPGRRAYRLFIALLDHAGDGGATCDVQEVPLNALNKLPNFGNLSRARVVPVIEELRRAGVAYASSEGGRITVSGAIDWYELADTDAGIVLRWRFGPTFVANANRAKSYGKLDARTCHALRGKYATILFRILSGKFGLRKSHWSVPVHDFRKLTGTTDVFAKFNKLRLKAIEPAVREISRVSPYEVLVHYTRDGRNVTDLVFSWEHKLDAGRPTVHAAPPQPTTASAAGSRRPSAQPPSGALKYRYTPMPMTMASFRDTDWEMAYRDAGCRADPMAVLGAFRKWYKRHDKQPVPRVFYSFCKGYEKRRERRAG